MVPKNGGKTLDMFDVWEALEEEVLHFIRIHCIQLQASTIPPQRTSQLLVIEILNESKVRNAIYLDCIQVVGLTMRFSLQRPFTIKHVDNKFVKGNMDYAGFSLNSHLDRPESIVLLIEIKRSWKLDVEDWKTLPTLMNRRG